MTLIWYRHNVKRGNKAFWLFLNLCYVRLNSNIFVKLAKLCENRYLIDNIKCKYKNLNHNFEVISSDEKL